MLSNVRVPITNTDSRGGWLTFSFDEAGQELEDASILGMEIEVRGSRFAGSLLIDHRCSNPRLGVFLELARSLCLMAEGECDFAGHYADEGDRFIVEKMDGCFYFIVQSLEANMALKFNKADRRVAGLEPLVCQCGWVVRGGQLEAESLRCIGTYFLGLSRVLERRRLEWVEAR